VGGWQSAHEIEFFICLADNKIEEEEKVGKWQ
jgi:hypothetical protein